MSRRYQVQVNDPPSFLPSFHARVATHGALLVPLLPAQDMIILPEEAVYKKIDTGREGERVYLMEIAGNRRFFYWMQDKDSDKDEVRSCDTRSMPLYRIFGAANFAVGTR